jgi:hypothetical protein
MPQPVLKLVHGLRKGGYPYDNINRVFRGNNSRHRKHRFHRASVSDEKVLRGSSFRFSRERRDRFSAGRSDTPRYRNIILFARRVRGLVRETVLQRFRSRFGGPVQPNFRASTEPRRSRLRGSSWPPATDVALRRNCMTSAILLCAACLAVSLSKLVEVEKMYLSPNDVQIGLPHQ